MARGGNLCLHIHLISPSEYSLCMCICSYFYLLKCFRLLVTENAAKSALNWKKEMHYLLNKKAQNTPRAKPFHGSVVASRWQFLPSFLQIFFGLTGSCWLLSVCQMTVTGASVSPDSPWDKNIDFFPPKAFVRPQISSVRIGLNASA